MSVPDRRRRIIPEVVLVRRWVIGVHVHNGMLGMIERYQLYICIKIIIGMNVVDNLNSV
jgi:hypothetical protein